MLQFFLTFHQSFGWFAFILMFGLCFTVLLPSIAVALCYLKDRLKAFRANAPSLMELALALGIILCMGMLAGSDIEEKVGRIDAMAKVEFKNTESPIQLQLLRAIEDNDLFLATRLSFSVPIDALIDHYGEYPEVMALRGRALNGEHIDQFEILKVAPVSDKLLDKLTDIVSTSDNSELVASHKYLMSRSQVPMSKFIEFLNAINPDDIQAKDEYESLFKEMTITSKALQLGSFFN